MLYICKFRKIFHGFEETELVDLEDRDDLIYLMKSLFL